MGVGSALRRGAIGVVAFALLAGTTQFTVAGAAGARARDGGRRPDHIFVIMMENHGLSQIIGNRVDAPFINRLASHNGLATNYYGVTHPSLPNYLSLFSGSFQGIWDDCAAGASITCAPEEFIPGTGDGTEGNYLTAHQIARSSARVHLFRGRNLVDQLEGSGLSWKAYMQSIPSVGSTVEYAPTVNTPTGPTALHVYAQKHDPFMYFADVNYAGSKRLKQIVPYRQLSNDLSSGNVPNFVWISPNQCRDMHGVDSATAALIDVPRCAFPDSGLDHGAIKLGDTFLKHAVNMITSSHTWKTTNSSLVIVWDEDDYTGIAGCCHSPVGRRGVVLGGSKAPAIVVNSWGGGWQRFSKAANHYTLLGTIEELWHLGCLANTCKIPDGKLLTPLFH